MNGLPPGADDTGDPAALLLDRAALLTAARRAGRRPGKAEPLPPCEPDPRPVVSPAAGRRLARMLGGEHPELLAEWLAEAAARGLRPAPEMLPALLDRARRARSADPGLADLVAEAGGPRARWLAGLNPDWDAVAAPAGQDVWRLGSTAQRRRYLARLLASDPDAARALIRDGWQAAGPAERAMFLSALAGQLSPADEPLLETARGDRAEEVRVRAVGLLSSLPGSALGQQVAERARRCVRIETGARGPRVLVTPPPAGPGQHDRARVVLEVVARAPLRTWTEQSGLTAAQIVAAPSGNWAPVLLTAWIRAATAQRDRDWTAALAGLDEPGPDAPPAVRAALRALRFRYDMLKELSHDGHDS